MSQAFDEFLKKISNFFDNNGFNILAAIMIFIIGYFVIKIVCKVILRIIYATKIDNAVGGFFVALFRFGLYLILFFIIASIMGISGNSFLVAFSSVALAIGLALKDSLANIANGIVIIVTKPFKKGDHIMVDDVEGIIKSIKILTTELSTFDNKKIVIPNSKIVSNSVINFTANPTRRLEFVFGVSYEADMKQVKKVIIDTINNYEETLKTPAPIVFMKAHNASSVDFAVRMWVNTSAYWSAIGAVNERIFEAFKENNIEIPYNQIDVHFRNALEGEIKNEKNNY